jgi:WD40 repeat protein
VRTLSFSGDGNRLVSVDSKGTLAIWDLAHRKEEFAFGEYGSKSSPFGAVFSPFGKSVVFSDYEGFINRLNLATKRPEGSRFDTGLLSIPIALAADGSILLTVGGSWFNYDCDDVVVWDLVRGKSIFGLKREPRGNVAAITPVGNQIAVGNRNGSLELWNVRSGKQVAVLKQDEAVACVAYAPNARLLASGGEAGTVKIWDTETRKEVSTLKRQRKSASSLAWSHDGRWLASGYEDGIVRIWDVAGGRERASFRADSTGECGFACCPRLEFDKDDKVLATGGAVAEDETEVKLWDTSFLAEKKKPGRGK